MKAWKKLIEKSDGAIIGVLIFLAFIAGGITAWIFYAREADYVQQGLLSMVGVFGCILGLIGFAVCLEETILKLREGK